MVGSRAIQLLIVVVLAAATTAAASDSAPAAEENDTKPSLLTPVAHTPLGSFEGADGPVADDATEDSDAAPVGSPIGTTMTEPKPELTTPPGAPTSGASILLGGPTGVVAAAVAAAAGFFAF
ncbi:hypothetical protein BAE44_0025854 [Dichanthelium oligosanthes]|uniref:Anther-specific protein BCP1 n=1 Tax=Dichanthelium oligosanthes TaxID=888268 RepID=A0A1E5UJZ3_9POAL|nr:hypothetical protein BAE44_0025854 [Dichanthelium oligosanthes]